MCNGDKACSSCSQKDKLSHFLPPGYIITKVMLFSDDGSQVNVGDNSVILFNLKRPLNSVVAINWTNTDLFYQLAAQPAIVSIDQMPNNNYTSKNVGYFAFILSSNNFIQKAFPPVEQNPRSYSQLTFRITDKTGALISGLTPWSIELEVIQKVNN